MVIRREQMEVFSASQRAGFVTRQMKRLRDRFAGDFAAMSEADLREWVITASSKADRYGYIRESEVELFIDLCAECGPAFDKEPWAAAILADSSLSSRERLTRLDAHFVFAVRQDQ